MCDNSEHGTAHKLQCYGMKILILIIKENKPNFGEHVLGTDEPYSKRGWSKVVQLGFSDSTFSHTATCLHSKNEHQFQLSERLNVIVGGWPENDFSACFFRVFFGLTN